MRKHSEEFKKEAVRLMQERGDQTVAEVAASLKLVVSQLYAWRKKYGAQIAKEPNLRGEMLKRPNFAEDMICRLL